jgi:hypothetical protein
MNKRAELQRRVSRCIIDVLDEHLSDVPYNLSIGAVALEEVIAGIGVQLAERANLPVEAIAEKDIIALD